MSPATLWDPRSTRTRDHAGGAAHLAHGDARAESARLLGAAVRACLLPRGRGTGTALCAHGPAVLDVGARDTQILLALDWFPRRMALDLQRGLPLPGVEWIVADFLRWEPPIRFDLVLCLQVLEHLEDPSVFFRKLHGAGRVVIVSVPYRWPQGVHPEHVQDPVDEQKLLGWAGQQPLETRIVMDERERLIAVFD